MGTDLAIRNKTLVQRNKSKRSIKNQKNFGGLKRRAPAQEDRRREKTRIINNKARERKKKARSKKGKGKGKRKMGR